MTHMFSPGYTFAPVCVVTPQTDPGARWFVSTLPGSMTVSTSAVTTTTFNYICMGNPN
jgi:hypothetical protein